MLWELSAAKALGYAVSKVDNDELEQKTQGGDLESVFHAAANDDIGLLVNSSRSIIFASSGDDYALAARNAAMDLQQQMKKLL